VYELSVSGLEEHEFHQVVRRQLVLLGIWRVLLVRTLHDGLVTVQRSSSTHRAPSAPVTAVI